MSKNTIWLRNENRITERRAPLLPDGAKKLINHGYDVVVERSQKRIIDDLAYQDAGCKMVNCGTWQEAPKDAIILGLKELPPEPELLKNTHIYFAHAYKEQSGWQDLLSRFTAGGGDLLDIEYMVEQNGRRVVAFGYWAGYMGAALALMHWHNCQSGSPRILDKGLTPFDSAVLLNETIIAQDNLTPARKPKVLIIGANGRCGHGARELLEQHGSEITCWGRDKTDNINREQLLDHDILINCAFIIGDVPAFLRKQDITENTNLSVVADVSCDPFSSFNPIPLYHDTTTWERPYITVEGPNVSKTVDIIAIDNLPSLLPREASQEFADLLLPHLLNLENRAADPVWSSAHHSFVQAISQMDTNQNSDLKKHATR